MKQIILISFLIILSNTLHAKLGPETRTFNNEWAFEGSYTYEGLDRKKKFLGIREDFKNGVLRIEKDGVLIKEFTIDNYSCFPYKYRCEVTEPGTYTRRFEAVKIYTIKDKEAAALGPISEEVNFKQIYKDTQPPTPPVIVYSTKKITLSVTLSATSSDICSPSILPPNSGSTLKKLQYKVGYEPWKDGNSVTVYDNKEVYFRAIDWANNMSDEVSYKVENVDCVAKIDRIDELVDNGYNLLVSINTDSEMSEVREYWVKYKDEKEKKLTDSTHLIERNGPYEFWYIDALGNNSRINNKFVFDAISIDTTAPVFSKPSLLDTGITKGGVNIELKATDNIEGTLTFLRSTDGINWEELSGELTSEFINDKKYYILNDYVSNNNKYYYRVKDFASNESGIHTIYIVNIDNILPQMKDLKLSTLEWVSQVDVNLSATDNVEILKYAYKDSNNEWQWLEPGITKRQVSANGTYEFIAMDTATNESDPKSIVVSNIDDEAPTYELVKNIYGWNNGNIIINTSDNKKSGVKSASWRMESDSVYIPSSSSQIQIDSAKFTKQGLNTIFLTIEDEAGNIIKDSSVSIQFDNKPPTIKHQVVESNGKLKISLLEDHNDTSKIDFTSVKYSLNPDKVDPNTITNWSSGLPDLALNSFTILAVEVKDKAGNIERKNIEIDKKGPQITIDGDYNSWFKDNVILKLTATDDTSVDNSKWYIKYEENGQWIDVTDVTVNGASILLNKLKPGSNNIFIKISDSLGNVSEKKQIIKFDNTIPVVSKLILVKSGTTEVVDSVDFSQPVNQDLWTTKYINENVELVSQTEDTGSSISFEYIKDGTIVDKLFFSISNGNEKSFTASVKVTDEAGNSTTKNVVVRLDKVAPIFKSSVVFENSTTDRVLRVKSLPEIFDLSLGFDNYRPDVTDLSYSFDKVNWTDLTESKQLAIPGNTNGENSVNFRFKDEAGNYGYDSVNFILDLGGPEVTSIGSLENPYVNISSKTVVVDNRPEWKDGYSAVNTDTLFYALSSETNPPNYETLAWTKLESNNTIPVSYNAEGKYYIHYRIEDSLGNKGYSSSGLEFIVDKTAPIVNSLKAYEKSGDSYIAVETQGYSKELDVYITPTATDNYIGGSGEIAGYVISKSVTRDTGFTEDSFQTVNPEGKYLVTLSSGVNYININAVDRAGNKSDSDIVLPVVVDNGEPSNLVISSTSHPEAVSEFDTVSNTTALFTLSADAGASGIANYNYKLYKSNSKDDLTADKLVKEGTTDSSLELKDLDDNFGDPANSLFEYYFLEVTPVSNNGKPGSPGIYQFRVDTKPPSKLKIESKTHPINNIYYSDKDAILHWQEPTDLTGIKQYYYLFIDHNKVVDLEAELKREDVENWTVTKDRNVSIDLNSFVVDDFNKSIGYGTVSLLLIAEDWAGERQPDDHQMMFDINKPVLEPIGAKESVFFNIDTATYSENIDFSFTWKQPKDLESGVKEQRLFLQSITDNQFKQVYPAGDGSESLGSSDTTFTIYGLSSSISNYRLVLDVIDNAGNKKSYSQFFSKTGVIDESPQYSMPFDNTFYGYRVVGETLIDAWADLYLPETLSLSRDGTTVDKVPLTLPSNDISVFESGIYTIDQAEKSLDFTIGGFNLKSYGINLDSNGLALKDVSLTLPDNSSLSFSSDFIVSSPRALIIKSPVAATSNIKVFNTSSWRVASDINLNFTFEGESLTIDEATLPIEPSGSRGFKIYRGAEAVTLSNIVLSPDYSIKEADFVSSKADPFYIDTANYKLKVNNAILRDNKILIEDGEILVENPALNIPVKDIFVDYSGEVNRGKAFNFTEFTYIYEGVEYSVNELLFTPNGLSTSGTFGFNGQTYNFSGQVLTNKGVDGEIAADIDTSIVINDFGGYYFKADNVKLKGGDLHINTAEIKLPVELGDLTKLESVNNIKNLVLKASDFSVKELGEWTISTDASAYSYGAGLLLESIKLSGDITSKAVSFGKVKVTPPSASTGAVIIFNNILLNRDGTLGVSDIVTSHDFTIGAFEYKAGNLAFNNDKIIVDALELTNADALDSHLNGLVFSNFSLNGSGVVTYGEAAETRSFNPGNWNFELGSIKQIERGITSVSTLKLPAKLGNREITFNNFLLNKAGQFVSGTTDYGQFLNIGGWRVLGKSISIEGENLVVGEGIVRLFSTMGGKELTFNGTRLSSNGDLILSNETVADVNFLSENGFSIGAAKYKLSDSGILLVGKILLPNALQNSDKNLGVEFSDYKLLLKSNGMINTLQGTNGLGYKFAGFNILGNGIEIDDNGLHIKNNIVSIPGIFSKDFGSIDFYASGEIKLGGEDFAPFVFKPFGENAITFTVKGVRLTEDGINLKSFVSLPKGFATEEIFFDKLTLHSDGTVTSDMAVAHLDFEQFGTHFDFTDIYLNGDGFTIGEAVITLPEAMESKQVTLNNFRITSDGQFELGSSSIDPFEMWGYTFYLDHLGFGDLASGVEKGVSFEGGVRLPVNFPVNELSGKRFSIRELEVPYSGNNIKFNVSLDDTIYMRLFNKWDMSITGISINQDFKLVINNGTIDLPKEFNTLGGGEAKLTIEDITIDPVGLTFDINSVTASNLSYRYNDLDFKIESVSLSQDRGLDVIEGSVLIPENDVDNPKYPEGFDNTLLTIHKFQVRNDFTIGDFDVSVTKTQSNSMINGLFYLEPITPDDSAQQATWKLALIKEGDDLFLGASATARLGDSFPSGIKGKKLTVGDNSSDYGIKVNVLTGSVERFDVLGDFRDPVTGVGMTYTMFGNSVETKELGLKYVKADKSYELEVNGTTLILDGASVPDFIKDTECEVKSFIINDKGKIKLFDSSIAINQRKEFFPGIFMENWKLGITADDTSNIFIFSVLPNGTNGNLIELGPSFPKGIKGTKSNINKFSVDSAGVIGEIDFNVTLSSSLTLFGDFIVRGLDGSNKFDINRGADLKFTKTPSGRDFLVEIKAGAKLPSSLPSGLSGLEIPVREFTFRTSGEIKTLDMGISNFNTTIYDQLKLVNGSMDVQYVSTGTDELTFDFKGDILLPAAASSMLGGVESFNIKDLKISSVSGLKSFDAAVTGSVTADLFAGMSFTFNKIGIGSSGIDLKGRLNLPTTLASGLPSSIDLNEFAIDWSGNITKIDASIPNISIKVGGFSTDVTNFRVNSNKITMDSFMVSLPQEMGGKKLGFKNAGFDYNGNFFGDCTIDKLETPDIAGFKIVFYGPTLDIENQQIGFDKVFCKTPDFVGGVEIGVNGVNLTPYSLSISGVEFGLPDFAVGGGLGFKSVNVGFQLDKGKYYVKGGGKLMIPGLGTFGAKVSFTNPSSVYPIGLEQAYFEWYADGPGIAMGTTGMFLNGIRGGLTFGPPIELPNKLKPMFDNGTRIQLGLTVADGSGGNLVRGSADIWLDITDWDWAFRGNLTVLNGMANAEVIAALTGRGFYGSLKVALAFVEGQVEVYIFDHNGDTVVSGRARVEFFIPKGAIIHGHFWFFSIHVPWGKFPVGSGRAEFGRFRRGGGFVDGVKGGISIGPFNLSAFVEENGRLDLFGASSYSLFVPWEERSRSRSIVLNEPDHLRVVSFDSRGRSSEEQTLNFRVQDPANALMTRSAGASSAPADLRETERLIFAIVYNEGDPVATAVSPTGKEYRPEDVDVSVTRTEWGMMFTVDNPEAGEWSIKVDNMPSPESYEVMVYGNKSQYELAFDSFGYNQKAISEPITLSGVVTPKAEGRYVEIFATEKNNSYLGYKVYETLTDADGKFDAVIDPALLDDGEVFIYANVNNGMEADIRAYAGGSLLINNSGNKLESVENLLLSENSDGDLIVDFDKIDNGRVKGYNLKLVNTDTAKTEEFYLGQLNRFVIPGLEPATYNATVTAVDMNGLDGEESLVYTYKLNDVVKVINDFTTAIDEVKLEAVVGDRARAAISIGTVNPEVTGTSYDFVTAELDKDIVDTENEVRWPIYPDFDNSKVDISAGSGEMALELKTAINTTPGVYKYKLTLFNMGNRELMKVIPVELTVKHPPLEVVSVSPETWELGTPGEFEVYGSGFVDGSKLFIDGVEVPTTAKEYGRLTADIPNNFDHGEIIVSVVSPSGEKKEVTVEGEAPTWGVLAYKAYSEVKAGNKTSLFFTIIGANGFDGTVPFNTVNLPEGWSEEWTGQSAKEGEFSSLTVTVPEGTPNGSHFFSITDSDHNEIPVEVYVTDGEIKPTISSLSGFSVFPGDDLKVFGFGFKEGVEIYIGDQKQEVKSWSSDVVTIKTSYDITSGDVKAVVGGVSSNQIILSVKERGFKIYPAKDLYKMQPGESVTIPVNVSGLSESVNLDLDNHSDYVTAYLEDSYLKLNGNTNVKVTLSPTIPNGLYPVVINGADGYSTLAREITIQVGDAYSFKTDEIPGFMEGVTTSFKLETENGEGETYFSLKDEHYLPGGLSLDSDGEISGKVYYGQDSKTVTIEAKDESGRIISQDFRIEVIENSWPLGKKDGGNSGYNPTPSPAEERVKWDSNINGSGDEILVANNRVFVRGSNGISVLDANSGMNLYTVRGDFSRYFYSSKTLFTLSRSGEFTAWETALGNKKWSRDGVVNYITDGFTLLIEDSVNCKTINIADGQLIKESAVKLADNMIWFRNRLFKYESLKLSELVNRVWTEIYSSDSGIIHSVVSDSSNLVVLTENGLIKTFDKDLKPVKDKDIMFYQGEMVLTDENIIVFNSGDTLILNRETLVKKKRLMTLSGDIVSAKEKFFVTGESGLETRNIYNGETIWSVNSAQRDISVVGEELFTLEADGTVKCYNGRNNVYAPTTTINPKPSEPDGKNGYYVTTPDVEILSKDPETFVKSVWYKYDRNAYSIYNDAVTLPDGEYSFVAYGVDSYGMRGLDDIEYFKIDTVNPETTMSKEYTDGKAGFTITEATFKLSATDETSGVEDIFYTLNGEDNKYTRPVYIMEEGDYNFSWWSEDFAGNVEDKENTSISVDLYKPVVRSEIFQDDRMGVLYLFAEDSFSGVNRIEYMINGSKISNYYDPLNLPPGETYNVTFRAVDNAGHMSEWDNVVLDLTDIEPVELIEDFETAWGNYGRYINTDLQVGDKLYTSNSRHNKIESLPDYLVGGHMITGKYNDKYSWERRFYKFEAGADIDLYIVKSKYSQLRLDKGWTRIDTDVEISGRYFPVGADVYHKAFKEDDDIVIGGTAMWQRGGPNLIIAQRSISDKLTIFSPNPDKDLYPLSKNWFAATTINGERNRTWSYRIADGEWTSLGNETSGAFNVPYVHKDSTLELRVQVEINNIIDPSKTDTVTKSRMYDLKNLSKIDLVDPVSGSQVLLNSPTPLNYSVLGIDGKLVDTDVSWSTSNGTIKENKFSPKTKGLSKITGTFNTYEKWVKEDSVTINVVDKYITETFNFNKSLTGEYSKHSDHRFYGFIDDDAKERLGETTYVVVPKGEYWSNNRETRMYIALEKDNPFEYLVNNGLYRVKATLGPVRRNDFPYIRFEDSVIDIKANHRRNIYTVETSIKVEDNKLTLTGSESLQIISLEVLRIDKPIETAVTPIDSYRVIKDMKWYRWNPAHYYPDWEDDDDDDDDDDDEEEDDLDD